MVAGHLAVQRLSQSRWARARWLVLAPHADDETLGTGALIAQAARSGTLAGVVYLTDGAGSHPHDGDRSRLALTALRRREAALSLRRLSDAAPPPSFLGWPDARPHAAGSRAFAASSLRLAGLCRRLRIDAIAVTAGHEPHCDHVAAFDLARSVVATAGLGRLTLFEYIVWAADSPAPPHRILRTDPIEAGRRHRALMAHRSQLGPAFGDGFRLPAWQTKMATTDRLYVRRPAHGQK